MPVEIVRLLPVTDLSDDKQTVLYEIRRCVHTGRANNSLPGLRGVPVGCAPGAAGSDPPDSAAKNQPQRSTLPG